MKVIGLIGGIASGKSAVAAEFQRTGAKVLDADRAAHRLLSDPEVMALLTQRWGTDILAADATVNRKKLAEIVFDPADGQRERHYLEQVLHPRIRTDFEQQMREFADAGVPAVVIDAPLLLEAAWQDMCDHIVFVEVPLAIRQTRAEQSRGWSSTEFAKREASQLPIEEKRARSTDFLDNSGTPDQLRQEVARFWQVHIMDRD